MQTKVCSKCRVRQPYTSFYARKTARDGLDPWCKGCCKGAKKRWGEANLSKRRAAYFRREYDLTPCDITRMLIRQGGACAVCGSASPKSKHGRFHVDHCHTSNRVRGLLCGPCNQALGLLQDSEETLEKAISYLRRSTERR